MAHDWKKFRTHRIEGRENPDEPVITLYQRFRAYEKQIAAVLAALLLLIWGVPAILRLMRGGGGNRVAVTRTTFDNLAFALQVLGHDVGGFPDTKTGLDALVTRPASIPAEKWHGPYFDKVPVDPWGKKFSYTGDRDSFTISSDGPDGRNGTADDIVYKFPPEGVATPTPGPQ